MIPYSFDPALYSRAEVHGMRNLAGPNAEPFWECEYVRPEAFCVFVMSDSGDGEVVADCETLPEAQAYAESLALEHGYDIRDYTSPAAEGVERLAYTDGPYSRPSDAYLEWLGATLAGVSDTGVEELCYWVFPDGSAIVLTDSYCYSGVAQ